MPGAEPSKWGQLCSWRLTLAMAGSTCIEWSSAT
jgi:hypothetical protein